MDLEIAFLDKSVGPKPGHQLALADQLAGALNQREQDVQRAAAETKGFAGLQQEPLSRKRRNGPNAIARSAEAAAGSTTTLYLF